MGKQELSRESRLARLADRRMTIETLIGPLGRERFVLMYQSDGVRRSVRLGEYATEADALTAGESVKRGNTNG